MTKMCVKDGVADGVTKTGVRGRGGGGEGGGGGRYKSKNKSTTQFCGEKRAQRE